jgi:hypothetical protein
MNIFFICLAYLPSPRGETPRARRVSGGWVGCEAANPTEKKYPGIYRPSLN